MKPKYVLVGNQDVEAVRCAVNERYQHHGHAPPTLPVAIMGQRHFTGRLVRREESRRRERIVFDFESRSLAGFVVSGEAFATGLSSSAGRDNQGFVACGQGRLLVNSHPPVLGDGAQGELVSPPFLIDRTYLSLLVGGGGRARVELWIDGRAVRTARGGNSEVLRERVWNVSDWSGQQAALHIVDDDPGGWGHVLVDDVRLFDRD